MKPGPQPEACCPECGCTATYSHRYTDAISYRCAKGHRWYIDQGGERFQVVRAIPGKAVE